MPGLDLNLITNAPNLTDRINQQNMMNAQIQTAQVDARQKQNAYAAQVMSAASANGDPQQYAKGKQLLASQGIDVSNWSDDPRVGAQQAQAARMALISPLGMLNSEIQMQRNGIQAAGVNSTMAPTGFPSLSMPVPASAPTPAPSVGATMPSDAPADNIPAFQQSAAPQGAPSGQPPSLSSTIQTDTQSVPQPPNPSDPKYSASGLNPKGQIELFKADLDSYNNRPEVLASKKQSEGIGGKTGEELGDAGKTYDVASAGLPYALKRFADMRSAAQNASSGLFVDNSGDGLAQQYQNTALGKLISPETGTANQTLKQFSSQGVLGELGPQLAQAGIRGNKFLESIAANASGLDMSAAPPDKVALVNGLQEKYVQNLKTEAAILRAHGQPAMTDAQIDGLVAKMAGASQSAAPASNGWGIQRIK